MEYKTVVLNENRQYLLCGFSKVDDKRGTAEIEIEKNSSGGSSVNFEKGQKINFIINGSYYEYYSAVVDRFDWIGGVIYASNLQNNARQLYKDIKVGTDMRLNILYSENDRLFRRNVRLKDISAGGFSFVCGAALDVDNKYEIILDVAENPIIVDFNIVRRIFSEEGNKFIYGCSFTNLCMWEEELIRKKVYQMISQKRGRK
ncbi:MAG: PilZ domain-containing protein [Firmicutes bacterium]|nr:PilZ domain-containing protein [Bacillota bacterium]